MATSELSRGKTIFVLTVVAGCFAVLWPKIFYPMFFGSPQFQNNVEKAHGRTIPQLNGCCDVYFEKDIQTLKIITQLCEENVLLNTIANSSRPLSKVAMLNLCYRQLQETCNIDLSNVFKMNERHELDSSFKQFISIVRTFNSSLCLKYHYNVNFNLLGTPRIINSNVMKPTSLINVKKVDKETTTMMTPETNGLKSQMRQERPPHMRPEMLHPALRENGRAIPHEHIVPRVEPDPVPRPVKQPGGPKPGMGRPAFGGGGPHAAKQGGGGIMNLLMPMYTISIVAFFIYTMLRFVSSSSNNARDGRNNASSTTDYYSSTELRSTSYYQEDYSPGVAGAGKKQLPEPDGKTTTAKEQEKPGSKLVVTAISGLLEQVNREILDSNPGLVSTEQSQDTPLAEDNNSSNGVAKASDSTTSGVNSKVDGGSEGEEELNTKSNGTVSTPSTTSTVAEQPVKPSSLNLKSSTQKPVKNTDREIYETDVELESDEEEEEEEEEEEGVRPRKHIQQAQKSAPIKGNTGKKNDIGLEKSEIGEKNNTGKHLQAQLDTTKGETNKKDDIGLKKKAETEGSEEEGEEDLEFEVENDEDEEYEVEYEDEDEDEEVGEGEGEEVDIEELDDADVEELEETDVEYEEEEDESEEEKEGAVKEKKKEK